MFSVGMTPLHPRRAAGYTEHQPNRGGVAVAVEAQRSEPKAGRVFVRPGCFELPPELRVAVRAAAWENWAAPEMRAAPPPVHSP